jgi:hypothetical protein
MKKFIAKYKYFLLTFAITFVLMMVYQFIWTSPDRLAGNDSYTHLAKAEIMRDSGFEKASYPSIVPFTFWGMIDSDNTLVYDMFLVAVTSISSNITFLKVFVAIVFALAITLFYKLASKSEMNKLTLFILVLASSILNIAFFLKFTELRSLVYSIILFYVTLAILFFYKDHYRLLIPIAFIYSLIHTTVFLVFAPIGILLLVDRKNYKQYLLCFAYVLIGIVLAILVYPSQNFYQILIIQPIIPFIYKMASFPINGAFEVQGDLTNPTYLLISNLVNILAVLFAGVVYVGLILKMFEFKYDKFKFASFVIFVLFFILDLFSRRFSDYLTPTMLIFIVLHKEELSYLLGKLKISFLKYRYIASAGLIVFGVVFLFFFYNKFLKDNLTNTDYKGDKKSNLPETYNASMYINSNVPEGSFIYNTAWEDFPYLIYYSRDYKYATGMELGFLYMYDSKMLRFYQDFRENRGFEEKDGQLIYSREDVEFKSYVSSKFKSNIILMKKGSLEKMTNYMTDNYDDFGLFKLEEDDYYVVYGF